VTLSELLSRVAPLSCVCGHRQTGHGFVAGDPVCHVCRGLSNNWNDPEHYHKYQAVLPPEPVTPSGLVPGYIHEAVRIIRFVREAHTLLEGLKDDTFSSSIWDAEINRLCGEAESLTHANPPTI